MKRLLLFTAFLLLLTSCHKELEFEYKTYQKKTSLACTTDCPQAIVTIPFAKNNSVVADSINKKIFAVTRSILYFGEKPYDATTYDKLVSDFIASYEKLQKDDPEDVFGWNGKIDAKVGYTSENLVDIEIDHQTFTGGAHGYSGKRSLIFDLETGKIIQPKFLFKNLSDFTKFAEAQFRKQFNIPDKAPINSGGLMFENEAFALPDTIFFTDKGLLLYYNIYEIAGYADGPQQLLIPYSEADAFLAKK
jgi:hypothetical protein